MDREARECRARPQCGTLDSDVIRMSNGTIHALIAVVIGLPGTILIGALAGFAVILGIGSLLRTPMPHETPTPSLEILAMIFWGIAGLFGLIGFWFWVLSQRPLSRNHRRIMDLFVFVGIVAAAPLVLAGPLYGGLAFLGCLTGIAILIDSRRTNYQVERDAKLPPK